MRGPRPWQPKRAWSAIGDRIADACKARGVGYRTLADRIGCSPQLVSKWIAGKGCPKESIAESIAAALSVDVEFIVKGSGAFKLEIERLIRPREAQVEVELQVTWRERQQQEDERRRESALKAAVTRRANVEVQDARTCSVCRRFLRLPVGTQCWRCYSGHEDTASP